MSHRLSPKERLSGELAILFKELRRKANQDIETISGHVRVSVLQLKQIESGRAYVLSQTLLLKVFEYLPIDDVQAREQASKLIQAVGSSERRRLYYYSQR
ncbi:MAG TPA: hypothetical protein PLZ99_01835 [Parcubacteria group bacterium]|nr:hypothetical protein [Parcubacteria group bacterium]